MRYFLSLIALTFLVQCNMNGDIKDTIKNQEEIAKKNIQRNNYLNEVLNLKNENLVSGSDTQSSTTNTLQIKKPDKEKYETMEGKKSIGMFFINYIVDWIKNKPISIKGRDGNPIKELEGKIRYCYSITPIKKNGHFTNETMPVVLFHTVKNGGEDLRVTELYLEDNPTIDLNKRKYNLFYSPPKTETATEPGYVNINPFWIMHNNKDVIQALTQSEYIKATIKVLNIKNPNNQKEYKILLDSSYLVQLINDTLQKYPELKTSVPSFKL